MSIPLCNVHIIIIKLFIHYVVCGILHEFSLRCKASGEHSILEVIGLTLVQFYKYSTMDVHVGVPHIKYDAAYTSNKIT